VHQPSHLIISWLVGHRLEDRRDRLLVTWAGLAPDIDGLSILGGKYFYTIYGWQLNSWQNAVITTVAIGFSIAVGVKCK